MTTEVDDASLDGLLPMTKLTFTDLITVYPNLDEYASVRKHEQGSWFIQGMCKILDNKEITNTFEIRDILDKVAEEVSQKRDKVKVDGGERDDIVQTSEYVVTGMTKKLYFPNRA